MFKYLLMQFKSQLEYKTSFILMLIAQLIAFIMYFVAVFSLFDKFGGLKMFNIYQVILGFSVIQFGESVAEGLLRGFDKFSELIKSGNFDLLLIRPQNIYLQILGTKIEFNKFVKAGFAIIMLLYSVINLKLYTSVINLLIIFSMLIGSSIIFASIFIIGAAVCFKTVEGLEIINIFVYGTRDFAQYPIGVYNTFVRSFFTYIIPVGLTCYYPMLYITGNSTNLLYAFLPFLSVLTLIPACLLFNLGVKKYKSTGS